MPDSAIAELLDRYLLGALLVGAGLGAALRLAGLTGRGGAIVAAAAFATAFPAGGWPAVLLLLVALVLAGAATLPGAPAGRAPSGYRAPDAPRATGIAALSVPALAFLWLSPATPVPGYLLAGFAAALAGATALAVAAALSDSFPRARYRPLTLRPTANGSAGLTLAGAGCGLVAAVLLAAAAFRGRLVGPGDPAFVALGGLVGMVVGAELAFGRSGSWRSLGLAALVGATTGTALVAFFV